MIHAEQNRLAMSPLTQGRELKLIICDVSRRAFASPLTQGRELKFLDEANLHIDEMSRPSRRGVN